jgi:hypothetical protein
MIGRSPSAASRSRGREIPFPVEKTAILRTNKVVYVVEGRRKITEGVEITVQKDVYVVGKGEGAVIEVEGALKVHGVGAREVIFENVTIELAPEFRDVQMDMAIFRKGAAVRTPEGKAVDGKFMIELIDFEDDALLDLTFQKGSIYISGVCSDAPMKLRAVDPAAAEENKVKLFMLGCAQFPPDHPGLVGGLIVEGFHDATVRISRLGGPLSACRNCKSLIFDGNKVNSDKLEFIQVDAGGFRKTKIMKCDVYSQKVTFYSGKVDEKTVDRIKVDRCWFKGIRDPKVVHAKVIEDAEDDESRHNMSRVILGKLLKRPLELAGSWDR